jgi:hypothetical protein
VIRPEDDYFHERSDDPYWNESAWFGFNVPERQLTGWVYFYHRPNMNYSVGGMALWDPSGEHEWDCLYYDWSETVALPAGAEMFDFSLHNGLTVSCEQPLRSFTLAYDNHDCRLDLGWEAFMEPQEAMLNGVAGLPAGSDEWGRGHYEHGGHMRGTIRVEGEEIAVDCLSLRDHSWGPRRYTTNPRGDFASAFASEESGFCMFAGADLPRDEDPCSGVDDSMIFGWYLREGEASRLVSGTRNVTHRDDRGRPLRVVVDGKDELGRELHAQGECVNWLWWHGYPYLFQWWSMCNWEFDGQAAVGEEQDFFPLNQGRRYIRSLRSGVVAA